MYISKNSFKFFLYTNKVIASCLFLEKNRKSSFIDKTNILLSAEPGSQDLPTKLFLVSLVRMHMVNLRL